MNKKRTWKQYRAIDLAMFALMLVVCEFIIVMAARFWFPGQPYTVSLAAAIVTIVYMRWGWWGARRLAGVRGAWIPSKLRNFLRRRNGVECRSVRIPSDLRDFLN